VVVSVDRKARVAERVRDVLARAVDRDLRDPRVGLVTLTAVRLSPDLRHATVFVSTLADEAGRAASLDALARATPFLRRVLARNASLRHTPTLRFVIDESLARGSRVESLLDDIARERGEDDSPDGPDDDREPSGS
jgi:ribosome-binding factor A